MIEVRLHGGELDRLLDRAHAGLVERIARRLRALGWTVFVEVSFQSATASVDPWTSLGSAPGDARTALIIEVKSAIVAVEETLRRHDTKTRLAPHIVFERIGERPAHVARLLVLPDDSTTRRRVSDGVAARAVAASTRCATGGAWRAVKRQLFAPIAAAHPRVTAHSPAPTTNDAGVGVSPCSSQGDCARWPRDGRSFATSARHCLMLRAEGTTRRRWRRSMQAGTRQSFIQPG